MNERVIEIQKLFEFLNEAEDVETVLDVGARGARYLALLKQLPTRVTGIDLTIDPEGTEADLYKQIDVLDFEGSYDFVICLSTIEHVGIAPIPDENPEEKRKKVFAKLLELSKEYVYCTFPFGAKDEVPNNYQNIDEEMLRAFKETANGWEWREEFYYSESPINRWIKVEYDFAKTLPIKNTRVDCVCILKLRKK